VITTMCIIKLPDDGAVHAKPPRGDVGKALRELFTQRAILITAAVEAAVLFSYGTFETFLPLYFIEKGLGPYETGAVLSAQIISVALSKPLMGRLSDRYGRVNQIIAGLILCAVSVALIHYAYNLVFGLVVSVLFGLCISVVTSATSALIADLSRKEHLSSSMGCLCLGDGHWTYGRAARIRSNSRAHGGIGNVFFVSSAVLAAALIVFTGYRRKISAQQPM
jgi:Major Facilitator Superfamily.